MIDAIFGFSFSGGNIRPPFDTMIEQLITDSKSKLVLSVDVPSGWPIEEEKCQENLNALWQPSGLISLSAPKECSKFISSDCQHFLGGRFVPMELAKDFEIEGFMRDYKETDLITVI